MDKLTQVAIESVSARTFTALPAVMQYVTSDEREEGGGGRGVRLYLIRQGSALFLGILDIMRIQTKLSNCWIRSWEPNDQLDLVQNANNRKIWLNLTDIFAHPYTEIDAEKWIQSANEPTLKTHLASEFAGIAVGGIGIICFSCKSVMMAT